MHFLLDSVICLSIKYARNVVNKSFSVESKLSDKYTRERFRMITHLVWLEGSVHQNSGLFSDLFSLVVSNRVVGLVVLGLVVFLFVHVFLRFRNNRPKNE